MPAFGQRAILSLLLLLPAAAHAQTKIPAAFLGTWAGGGIGANNAPAGTPPIELPYQQLDKKLGDFLVPWAFAQHEPVEGDTDDTAQAYHVDAMFRPGSATD